MKVSTIGYELLRRKKVTLKGVNMKVINEIVNVLLNN